MRIKYFHETDPKAKFRQENPPQTGSGFVTINLDEPDTMEIRYINDRGLGGTIALHREPTARNPRHARSARRPAPAE